MLPLRVYLSASFVFFVGSHLLPHSPWEGSMGDAPIVQLDKPEPAASGATGAPAVGERRSFDQSVERCAASPPRADCSPAEAFLSRLVHAANAMSRAQWTGRLTALAPYGMLAMQPVFAALLLLMFAGSGRRYAEHFVFSLHCHSLWFLALLLALATDAVGQMQLAVFCRACWRCATSTGWAGGRRSGAASCSAWPTCCC